MNVIAEGLIGRDAHHAFGCLNRQRRIARDLLRQRARRIEALGGGYNARREPQLQAIGRAERASGEDDFSGL